MFLILATVLIQGLKVYTCHSEGTIHLISSCCDEIEFEESCCESEKSLEKQINEKCCSQDEVEFTNNFNGYEDYKHRSYSDSNEAFYASLIQIDDCIEDKSLSANTLFNNSPPPTHRQIYVKICSFLC